MSDRELGTNPVVQLLIEMLVYQGPDQMFVFLQPLCLSQFLFTDLLLHQLTLAEQAGFVIFAV